MNNKNLLAKTILIIAVLIVFLFGIIGIPSSFTAAGLKDSLQKRIHLGLDLEGRHAPDSSGAGQ